MPSRINYRELENLLEDMDIDPNEENINNAFQLLRQAVEYFQEENEYETYDGNEFEDDYYEDTYEQEESGIHTIGRDYIKETNKKVKEEQKQQKIKEEKKKALKETLKNANIRFNRIID